MPITSVKNMDNLDLHWFQNQPPHVGFEYTRLMAYNVGRGPRAHRYKWSDGLQEMAWNTWVTGFNWGEITPISGVITLLTYLEPQTTIYKWLFQWDDSKSLYRKLLLFGVPGTYN